MFSPIHTDFLRLGHTFSFCSENTQNYDIDEKNNIISTTSSSSFSRQFPVSDTGSYSLSPNPFQYCTFVPDIPAGCSMLRSLFEPSLRRRQKSFACIIDRFNQCMLSLLHGGT